MKKFLVIGPTFLDIHVFMQELDRKPFETTYSAGGKGFNIAKNLKLFDMPVVLATMYGDDLTGKYLHQQLHKNGIEAPQANFVNHPTSLFVGVHNQQRETIFDKADISIFGHQILPEINWEEISVAIILSSTNHQVLDLLREKKKQYPNIKFVLEISGSKTISAIFSYLSMFDMYISNRKEAQALADTKKYTDDIQKIVSSFLENTFRVMIVTLDKDGILFGTNTQGKIEIKQESTKELSSVESTIGAGDSVTAAFCTAYFGYNLPIEKSISIAMELATHTLATKESYIHELPESIKNQLKINF